MNVVFVGASRFGLRCLEACMGIPGVTLTGVVTAPQTFKISYRPEGVTNVLHVDVVSYANKQHIPVAVMEDSMKSDGLLEKVASWNPDAFIVAGWYHMIPREWRELAPAYGLHASLLPDYSGGAPLVWAMINGENKTGITLFEMDGGVDSGPIAAQKEEPIRHDDTIASLYARIEQRGLDLLNEALPLLASGKLALRPQDDARRRVVPQRGPEDGVIDWGRDAAYIDRFIRAQTRPYPGAFTTLHGSPLHIWEARVDTTTDSGVRAGRVSRNARGLYSVACGANAITLLEVTYQQKTYLTDQLAHLFAEGGQVLGDWPED